MQNVLNSIHLIHGKINVSWIASASCNYWMWSIIIFIGSKYCSAKFEQMTFIKDHLEKVIFRSLFKNLENVNGAEVTIHVISQFHLF